MGLRKKQPEPAQPTPTPPKAPWEQFLDPL